MPADLPLPPGLATTREESSRPLQFLEILKYLQGYSADTRNRVIRHLQPDPTSAQDTSASGELQAEGPRGRPPWRISGDFPRSPTPATSPTTPPDLLPEQTAAPVGQNRPEPDQCQSSHNHFIGASVPKKLVEPTTQVILSGT